MSAARGTILGRFTRTPELRYLPNGTAVADIDLAVNHKYKKENGEKIDEVSFFTGVAFGAKAETIAKYFAKGQMIFVEGRLSQDKWDDKQTGQKRTKIKLIVENFAWTGDNTGHAPGEAQPAGSPAAPRPAASPTEPAGYGADDDVPF